MTPEIRHCLAAALDILYLFVFRKAQIEGGHKRKPQLHATWLEESHKRRQQQAKATTKLTGRTTPAKCRNSRRESTEDPIARESEQHRTKLSPCEAGWVGECVRRKMPPHATKGARGMDQSSRPREPQSGLEQTPGKAQRITTEPSQTKHETNSKSLSQCH